MSAQTPQTDEHIWKPPYRYDRYDDCFRDSENWGIPIPVLMELLTKALSESDRLKALCEECDLALLDWLHQYASEECNPARVQETVRRIFEGGGTLCYIARLRKRISAALKKAQKDI